MKNLKTIYLNFIISLLIVFITAMLSYRYQINFYTNISKMVFFNMIILNTAFMAIIYSLLELKNMNLKIYIIFLVSMGLHLGTLSLNVEGISSYIYNLIVMTYLFIIASLITLRLPIVLLFFALPLTIPYIFGWFGFYHFELSWLRFFVMLFFYALVLNFIMGLKQLNEQNNVYAKLTVLIFLYGLMFVFLPLYEGSV